PPYGNRVDIFIGGNAGTILHYTGQPGPAHFRLLDSGTTRSVSGLWGLNAAFIKGVTVGGEILEYDGADGGVKDRGSPDIVMKGVYQDEAANLAIAVGEAGTVVRHDFTGWLAPTTVGAANLRPAFGSGATVFIGGNGLATSANDGQAFGGFQLTG